jgi:Dynamin-like helical domain/50S ribosome-binding GTPase
MIFNAAVYGEKFDQISGAATDLLGSTQFHDTEYKEQLTKEINTFKERGFLTVAFVGEYSAGKSTIISALTSRRDLKISADIATDTTAEYPWHGVKVIDTPGLWTERKDHDATTLAAISRADLLVYCLTYSLFDTTTLNSFHKLAFDMNYQTKMMLLVNKMSAEGGDDDEKIQNYTASLKDSLRPHELTRFPTFFCDARDYIEGTDDKDSELIELSRFNKLTEGLNQFVEEKGALARLDTPLRIVLSYLDRASDIAARNGSEDDAFAQLLTNMTRSAEKNRQALRGNIDGILLELEQHISKLGRSLAQQIGISESIELDLKKSELTIQEYCQKASQAYQETIENTAKSIQEDLGKDFNSPLMDTYIKYATAKLKHIDSSQSTIAIGLKKNLDSLKSIASKVGIPINQALSHTITGKASNYATASGGIAKATQVSGSALHSGIYATGKFIGYSFKPWQAVNLAKNIGNAVAVVGVVLSIASIFMDAASEVEEVNNERKISEAKRDLINEYQNIALSLVKNFRDGLQNIEHELFGQVEILISEARSEQEESQAVANETIRKIITIRKLSNELLSDIAGHQKS